MIHRDITPFPFPNDLFWKHAYPEFMSDPLGSYTGVPDDPNEQPVQDADDLS